MRAYDPEGMEQAKRRARRTSTSATDPYACADGADALVIVTEWDAFRALDLDRVKSCMKQPVIVDLRNIYRPEDMAQGFAYLGVGRPDGQGRVRPRRRRWRYRIGGNHVKQTLASHRFRRSHRP